MRDNQLVPTALPRGSMVSLVCRYLDFLGARLSAPNQLPGTDPRASFPVRVR